MDRTIPLRFLVSGSASGSIIGKGGATISEIEAQSGSRVQLSKPKETFPGTSDRILLLTGTISCILTALHLLISKIVQEEEEKGEKAPGAPITVKLVAPNATCGAILGKQGATMRSFTDDSGAEIKLSNKESMFPGVTDRVVTICGSMEQALRATALVSSRITDEPAYPPTILRPYTYNTSAPAFGTIASDPRANSRGDSRGPGAHMPPRDSYQPRAPPSAPPREYGSGGGGGGGGGGAAHHHRGHRAGRARGRHHRPQRPDGD